MKLKKPAQVGNTIFGKGCSERMVIERAQREYIYKQDPKVTAARLRRLKRFFKRTGASKPTGLRRVDRTAKTP